MIAVIGSRNLKVNIEEYIPDNVTKIISGGATGIDTLAAEYADGHGIPITVFLPEYCRYGRAAPLIRNRSLVDAADSIIAIWDGKSRGTKYTIDYALKLGKPVRVYMVLPEQTHLM